jgi:hypothetical protein
MSFGILRLGWEEKVKKFVVIQFVKKSHSFMELEILFHFHKTPTSNPVLRQLNTVRLLTHSLSEVHFYIIIPSIFGFCRWSLPRGFPSKFLYRFLIFLMRAACLVGLYLLNLIGIRILDAG